MVGTAVAPALSPRPMVVTDGVFNLFVNDPVRVETKNMKYSMKLTAEDGRSWWFEGYKLIHKDHVLPTDLWEDTTTLYVTLEPCSHHCRTPPCADALVRAAAPPDPGTRRGAFGGGGRLHVRRSLAARCQGRGGLAMTRRGWKDSTLSTFAVTEPQTGEVLGSIGIHWIDTQQAIAEVKKEMLLRRL